MGAGYGRRRPLFLTPLTGPLTIRMQPPAVQSVCKEESQSSSVNVTPSGGSPGNVSLAYLDCLPALCPSRRPVRYSVFADE